MGNIAFFPSLITVAWLLTGCQSSGEEVDPKTSEESSENEHAETTKQDGITEGNRKSDHSKKAEEENSGEGDVENPTDDAGTSNEDTADTEVYGGAQITPHYFIDTHVLDDDNGVYTVYTISRGKDEDKPLAPEQRLETSLLKNDPSEQDLLDSYADLSVEGSMLYVQFNTEGSELDAPSSQSNLFFDALFGISDLYGMEEITFLNPDGIKGVSVAQRSFEDSVSVNDERGVTRGYYTIYDEERKETLFLPGNQIDEPILNEKEEPFSFPETIEKMGSINHADAFYSSAIVEGIEVLDSSMTNGVAKVQYTMDKDIVTEADRIVFEHAIQLAALDFHAWEVQIMNDTLKESTTYPLIGQ